MSDDNEELFAEVNSMMQGADDQISIEKVLIIASRIAMNLEAYRAVVEKNTAFSDEWIETSCTRLFNTFFRNGA